MKISTVLGTILGAEITRFHKEGLPEDTIVVGFARGVGGQSFEHLFRRTDHDTLRRYQRLLWKRTFGGKLVVYPPKNRGYKAEENIIVGNVALYGATARKSVHQRCCRRAFRSPQFRERSRYRRGDEHGCEYMTGGRVAVLENRKNFAAGMSGGIAYVLDENSHLYRNLNKAMIAKMKKWRTNMTSRSFAQ